MGWRERITMGTELVRPTVLDAERCNAILQYLAEGNRLIVALRAAGVTHECFRLWENRVKAADPDVPSDIADFIGKVRVAEAASEVTAVRELRSGRPGWQGSAWFLERRFPQRWGKQDRTTLPAPAPPKPIDQMTDEELERFDRDLEGKARRRT